MKATLALVALATFAMAAPSKEGAEKSKVTESEVSIMEDVTEFDFYAGKDHPGILHILQYKLAQSANPFHQPPAPPRPGPGAVDTPPTSATTSATGTAPTPGSAPAGLAAASTKRPALTRPRVVKILPSSVAAAVQVHTPWRTLLWQTLNTLPGVPEVWGSHWGWEPQSY